MSRLSALLLVLFLGVTGCGRYAFTYEDAFPPEPVRMARWDPPDSVAFMLPEPPRVAAVIQDKEYYYLLHQPGEAEFLQSMREQAERERRQQERAAATAAGLGVAEATGTLIPDEAPHDSLFYGPPESEEPVAVVPPQPPVRFDLSEREKEVYRRRSLVDLQRAETLLVLLDNLERSSERDAEQVRSVRAFVELSQQALAREDLLGASNLALKARALAEDLYESRP